MKIKKIKSVFELMAFVAPFLIIYLIFFLYPFCQGIFYSFTEWNGLGPIKRVVGFQNYIDIFKDIRFISSLKITLIFTISNVVLSNVLGIVLSVLIEKTQRSKNILRTIYFFPYVFSLIVVGFIWKIIFSDVIPFLVSEMNASFLNLGYIGNPKTALMTIVFVNVWYSIGYYIVIYIAGLQSLDTSIIESSVIDGANGWKQFTRITLPLIMPSITICMFTSTALSLKVFDLVIALTQGGPGFATETLAVHIFYQSFLNSNAYGLSIAKAVVLAILILIVSYFELKFLKNMEVEA